MGFFTKYLPRKDANVSYIPTFLIGRNMYDEDHDVDKDLKEAVDVGVLDGFEDVQCGSGAAVVSVNFSDASDVQVVHQIMDRYPKQCFDR